jgi:outer membrane protein OmpA-like peptidoglycan-associated protein
MYRLLLILFFSVIPFFNYSQFNSQNSKLEYWQKNNATIDLQQYYLNTYSKDTSDLKSLILLAHYEYLNKEYLSSKVHLEKFIRLSSKKDFWPYYLLGETLFILGDYDKARISYKESLILAKKEKNRPSIQLLNRRIESVNWAIENNISKKNTLELPLKKFEHSKSIITNFWEDSTLLITLTESDNQVNSNLIFYNPYSQDTVRIRIPNVNKRIGSITKDYSTNNNYYLSLCGTNNKCNLYYGSIVDNVLTDLKIISGLPYSDSTTYTMPTFAKIDSKNYLFFSSNSKNHIDLDIYYGELYSIDSLTEITNINHINTETDDISPYYNFKDSCLYFSNAYMNGYGGFDIFKTKFSISEKSNIHNIGKPFNSSYNDYYFNEKDTIITITTNRSLTNNCCNSYIHFVKNTNQIKENALTENRYTIDSSLTELKTQKKYQISTKTDKFSTIKNLFPIKLYFHNDIPNPKSLQTVTSFNYQETYFSYLGLKNEYLTKNESINKEEDINHFFDQEIVSGFNDLNELLYLISEEIKNGSSFKILVKGYASPLASNQYNINLSKRRIHSVFNYIKSYKNGVLAPYLGNRIVVEEVPFGEEKSEKETSDDPKNKKKSIYSIEAAHERKIELIGIEINNTQNKEEYNSNFITVKNNYIDLSTVEDNEIEVVFEIHNESQNNLNITNYTNNYQGIISIEKLNMLHSKTKEKLKCKIHLKKIKGNFKVMIHLNVEGLDSPINLTIVGIH